jgi:hypothetical protein
METVPWQNLKKYLQGGTLRNLTFEILSMQDIKLTQKTPGAKISTL